MSRSVGFLIPDSPSSTDSGKSLLGQLYRQTRFSSRRIRKRVVFKHGDVNVIQGNVAKRRRKYLQDIFTTLVDAQWRWTLLVFSLNFLLSWLLFALIWWLIALSHGDLDAKNNAVVAAYRNETFENPNWVPCVVGINSFASCFLFSIETQHTIGYGGRSTSEECPEAIFVMCIQSIVGVMIQAFMVGIVFVKLSRPIKRTHTLLFSRNAVICQRDGVLCLMFRVGDMRKSHIIEAHIRAQLIRRKVTKEGELLPFYQEELKVGGDGEEDRIFFIWPTTIVHKIGPESPLYRLSAADMFRERFEIVVILEGIVESTGMTTQARSSYLPNEILWGHRFEALISFKKETGEYEVDYGLFNNTYEVETPLCSAYTLDQLMQLNYSSQARSELNSNDNYELRRTASEILEVNSVDSRIFSEKTKKLIGETTLHEPDDQNTDIITGCNSSDEDPLIENTKELRDNNSNETPPNRLPLISLNSALEDKIMLNSLPMKKYQKDFKDNLEEIKVVNPLTVPGPANYDDAQTPDTETSPVIDPAEVPCLAAQWQKNVKPSRPLSLSSGKRYKNQNVIFPKRSVLKNGQCNVLKKSNNSKRRIKYLQDIFTTLVDVQWRWTLLVFALSFIMSWLLYAGLYWLIAYAHGDFEHLEDEKWTPCVENLNNFASCFLFSVETQHTIGYGGRATTEECPEAIVVMCIQSITGVMISAFMAGIFFAKMSRPKHRRQTLLFSRRAVICQRDAQLCFMFRVGDMRKSHIIGTNISAHIFRTRTTREGEELHQYQCKLQVSADGCDDNIFFIWPLTMVHVINKDSPLYSMSAQDLLHEEFEIVAILEGTVESTGQTTQARTSYLATEIKWGHRFESVLSYNFDRQCYEIDYKKFNNTVKVSTPLCSAKDLDELYMFQSEICEYNILTSEPDTDNQ